jgi:hypothetical protein
MQLESLRSYKTSFGLVKIILISVVVSSFCFCGFVYWLYVTKGNEGYKTTYVIDSSTGSAQIATQNTALSKEQRYFEYKNHIRMFYGYFYSFDQFTYKNNVENALYLIGNSGKELYAQYKESDVLRRLQEDNLKVSIQIDSVDVDYKSSPMKGICLARQTVERSTGKLTRNVHARFNVYELDKRSDKNPHGLLIDNFVIFDNQVIPE